ncbi:uncharacterized protein [Watersipora subatra]|uniref:uncharacterized protein n=1 Tax=Watersipora subatra TaxID=2589382 RepID=UPI00355B388A
MSESDKAAGSDGIPTEVYKYGEKHLENKLLEFFQQIWASETIPADLKNVNIITIFKKGIKSDGGNYTGISLLSIAEKMLFQIIGYHLGQLTETCLPESQCGFEFGRSTVDCKKDLHS